MLCPSWGESLDQAARPSPRARRFLFGSGPVIGGAGAVAISTPLSGSSCSRRASPPSPGRRRAAYRATPCPMGAVSSEPLAARLPGRLAQRHDGGAKRGLRWSVNRVIVPPLPAASRPLEGPPEFLPPSPRPKPDLGKLGLQQRLADLKGAAAHLAGVGACGIGQGRATVAGGRSGRAISRHPLALSRVRPDGFKRLSCGYDVSRAQNLASALARAPAKRLNSAATKKRPK